MALSGFFIRGFRVHAGYHQSMLKPKGDSTTCGQGFSI